MATPEPGPLEEFFDDLFAAIADDEDGWENRVTAAERMLDEDA